jgi:hypothetical protein
MLCKKNMQYGTRVLSFRVICMRVFTVNENCSVGVADNSSLSQSRAAYDFISRVHGFEYEL